MAELEEMLASLDDDDESSEDEEETEDPFKGQDVLFVDIGTRFWRAGFSHSQVPIVQPYKKPYRQVEAAEFNITEWVVDESDYQQIESSFQEMFTTLGVTLPCKYPTVISVPCLPPSDYEESLWTLMLEKFGCPAVLLDRQPIFTAYAHGIFTGLVMDIGYSSTQVIPIIDGREISQGVLRVAHMSACQLIRQLGILLKPKADDLGALPDTEEYDKMMEEILFLVEISPSLEAGLKNTKLISKMYTSPITKTEVEVGEALVRVSEMFFQPRELMDDSDTSFYSVQELLAKASQQVALDDRHEVFENICLSGAVTNIPGFDVRLQEELNTILPNIRKFRVHNPPELKQRENTSWQGARSAIQVAGYAGKWFTLTDWEILKEERREARRCNVCKVVVEVGEAVWIGHQKWHVKCFRCSYCKKSMSASEAPTTMMKREKAICSEKCALKAFCATCDEYINGDRLAVGAMTVHKSCGVQCVTCSKPLGTKFKMKKHKPVCDVKCATLAFCPTCNEFLQGSMVKAGDQRWHTQCATCYNCKKGIDPNRMLAKGRMLLCSAECEAAKVCACCKEILKGKVVKAGKRRFHVACLVCPADGKTLDPRKFAVKKGQPLCSAACATKAFCQTCDKVIPLDTPAADLVVDPDNESIRYHAGCAAT